VLYRGSNCPLSRAMDVRIMRHGISAQGGRHYSDRLCSDRRYSDNLQSGRTSTSLARLAYVEIVEIGKKLEWVEALDASKARH